MTCWKLGLQAKCPRCPFPNEDKEHVLQCLAESAVLKWKKVLEQLDNWMTATKMNPQLKQDSLVGFDNGTTVILVMGYRQEMPMLV